MGSIRKQCLRSTAALPSPRSPEVDPNMALYRFEHPALPGLELPVAQPFSPGDVRLNEGNPIVELDGSEVDNACNGDVVR